MESMREKKNIPRTLLKMLFSSMNELECDELVSTLLKTLNDFADEAPLDTIGLVDVSIGP